MKYPILATFSTGIGIDILNTFGKQNKQNIIIKIVKPWPQTLSPKPFSPKPQNQGALGLH